MLINNHVKTLILSYIFGQLFWIFLAVFEAVPNASNYRRFFTPGHYWRRAIKLEYSMKIFQQDTTFDNMFKEDIS